LGVAAAAAAEGAVGSIQTDEEEGEVHIPVAAVGTD